MGCDLQVVRSDERSTLFQRSPHTTIDRSGIAVEIHARDLAEKDIEASMVLPAANTLLRTVAQLRNRNGADTEFVGRRSLRLAPPEQLCSVLDAPPIGLLTPACSLTNYADLQVAMNAALAEVLVCLIITATHWPGIATGLVTAMIGRQTPRRFTPGVG